MLRASHGSWWMTADGESTAGPVANGLSRLEPEPRAEGGRKGGSCDEKDGRRADGGRPVLLKLDGKETGGG